MNSKDKTPIILYLGEFNNQLEAEIVVKEKRGLIGQKVCVAFLN